MINPRRLTTLSDAIKEEPVAYDTALEKRIDTFTPKLGNPEKKSMFGGIGYLINGNLCFGIHKNSLVLRISPEDAVALLNSGLAKQFDISGRPMKGWVLIPSDQITSDDLLTEMLNLGYHFAETLPAK
jgi:TfoX/Sxy family transcriptional regulator of competence genes